jgi:hypothetical protein
MPPMLSPPSAFLLALLVARATKYLFECFPGSAHFLLHGAAFSGIPLLLLG